MHKKVVLILFVCLLSCLPAEAQCAMCRAVLESEEGNQAAKGINNGIIYLMVFPYLLVGGVVYFIYKMRQKASSEEN